MDNVTRGELTREEWMVMLAGRYIWPLISLHMSKPQQEGEPLEFWSPPKTRLSIGFPKGSRGGKGGHAIGQCWPEEASADKAREVFISPELMPFDVAHVLIHELIHSADGNKSGHKGEFKRLAKAVGLRGKMTQTVPGDELKAAIEGWLTEMPPFPHAVLTPVREERKKGSRLIKASCLECEYTLRVTRKWLEIAIPRCPNPGCEHEGISMSAEESDEGEGE